MKVILRLILFCTALACYGATVSPEQLKTAREITDFSKYAMMEETFRKMAVVNAEDAGKVFFNHRAAIRWNRLVNEFSQICISDFFSAAVVLRGQFDHRGTAGAFYNPFWDTLFIFRSSPLPGVPVFERFHFIPGEAFRNEEYSGVPDFSTVVSLKDPHAINLLRKTMLTIRKFNATLADNMDYDDFLNYRYAGKNEEIMQIRAGMRLKLKAMLMKNKKHCKEAYAMCAMLRRSNEKQLKNLFHAEDSLPMVGLFCQLPAVFKKDFTPYGYVPTKEGRLYIMVNKKFPRLFVTMTFFNSGSDYMMEWYDLNDSEKIIRVWNSRKEIEK